MINKEKGLLDDDLTKSLNELLYYDHEEFQNQAAYNEGNKEGRKEEKIKIAKSLLNSFLTEEEIAKHTNLALLEVQNLKKQVK